MSVRVMALVWDSTVPAPARFTLLALADRADENGRCWPSIPLLARKCQTTQNTIRAHLKKLERAGLIAVSQRSGTSSVYTIDVAQLLACQDVETAAEVSVAPAKLSTAPPNSAGDPPRIWTPPKSAPPPKLEADPPQNLKGTPPKICTQSITDPSVDPSLIHHSPPTAQQTDPPGFEDFWATYPKRVAKPDARKAWTAATKSTPADLILVGAKRYAEERKGQDPKYTAHPATWLRRESWSDEPQSRPITVNGNGYQPWKNPADQSVYDEDV